MARQERAWSFSTRCLLSVGAQINRSNISLGERKSHSLNHRVAQTVSRLQETGQRLDVGYVCPDSKEDQPTLQATLRRNGGKINKAPEVAHKFYDDSMRPRLALCMKEIIVKNLSRILSPHFRDISPLELKLLVFVLLTCDDKGIIGISTYDLALKSNIPWKDVEQGLGQLKTRWLIDCTLDNSPFKEIQIRLLLPVDNSYNFHERKKAIRYR